MVGSPRPAQNAGERAEAPAGMESERVSAEPWTLNGSLPDTTFAPPASCQRELLLSKSPPGASVYAAGSSHRRNGCPGVEGHDVAAVAAVPAEAGPMHNAPASAVAARASTVSRRRDVAAVAIVLPLVRVATGRSEVV